jgi:DNA-directed RNA polymerase subunit RPC12/RpoP
MNMGISEKVAYLKGLAEGLSLDESTKEGKLLLAILDVLDDMAEEFSDIEEEIVDLEDGLDAVSDDLNDVEEFLYETSDDEEDDEEEDDEEYFVTTCPECEEEVIFDESVLEDGEVVCPNCGTRLEFVLSDLVNAVSVGDEEGDED